MGCQSHHFVARNAIKVTTTINDILEQEVIDNIAVFAANRDAMPYFAIVGDGTAQVTDSGSVSPTLMFNAIKFTGANFGMNASRGLQENWKLSPCMTAGRLARLRCAFQFVFGHPVPEIVDGRDGTTWVRLTEGCFKCVEEMVRVGILPTPVDGNSPLKAIDPTQDGGWIFNLSKDKVKNHDAAVAYATKLQQGLDCAFPTGWFRTGRKCDLPKRVCYSASACDTYVWVCPDGMDAFSRFTITVVALATVDPPGQLANYFPSSPPPKSPSAMRHALSQFTNDFERDQKKNPKTLLHSTKVLSLDVLNRALLTESPNPSQLLLIRGLAETTISTLEESDVLPRESRKLLESAHQLINQIDDYLAPPQPEAMVPMRQQVIPNAFSQPGSMPFSRGCGIEFFPQTIVPQ
jgi:hypothetical protein